MATKAIAQWQLSGYAVNNQVTSKETGSKELLDLIIRQGRTLDGDLVDIAIAGDCITAVEPHLGAQARQELPAHGAIVLPGLVNAHLHVDKALTAANLVWCAGTFQESIDLTLDLRRRYTAEDLRRRGQAVLDQAIVHGTSALRAFADVGTVGGLAGARALCKLRDEFRGRIDVQVVAFPQEGLLRDPGADRLLEQAMDLGCDIVGCFPWFELTNEQARIHIDFCFELAKRLDRDLHAFVDDEPIAPHRCDLEQLAVATIAAGWEGRVTASHACGIASYDNFRADRLMRLVAQAGISVCSNAHVSLVSKCQHAPEPIPRGITRVRELIACGVNVVCAQDDVADPYYPFGRADLLEVASFLAHTAHLYQQDAVRHALDAVTVNAAKGMRLPDYGLAAGDRADIVVLESGTTPTDVLRLQPARRYVLHRGRVVAETTTTTMLHRPEGQAR